MIRTHLREESLGYFGLRINVVSHQVFSAPKELLLLASPVTSGPIQEMFSYPSPRLCLEMELRTQARILGNCSAQFNYLIHSVKE